MLDVKTSSSVLDNVLFVALHVYFDANFVAFSTSVRIYLTYKIKLCFGLISDNRRLMCRKIALATEPHLKT